MAAEGSEPAQQAPAAQPAARPSLDNQQVRIAVLVVLAIVVGVVLWLVLSGSPKHKGKVPGTTVVFQSLFKPAGLKVESATLNQPIYWAGPKKGARYEFTQEKNGHLFVRYLTHGAKKGVKGADYLVVATYKWPNAYSQLKKLAQAGSGPLKGPDHSIIYLRPHDQRSVLMAWPKVNYEVEVYYPVPTKAAQIAASGDVKPVG